MKTVITYPYFVFATNPLQDGKISDFTMLKTADASFDYFVIKHPRCNFEVVHFSRLSDAQIAWLETPPSR